MVRPAALTALLCAFALVRSPPAQAGRASEARAESRRQETERAVDQIISGQGVQGAISRILYLGNQAYATAVLTRALERAPDAHTKQNIALAFSLLGAKNGEQALYGLVKDDDPGVRMNALQALTKLRSADPRKIGPLLRDKNLGVRREAARALGAAHRASDSRLLMDAARVEDEPEARAAMLIAAGDTGDKKQVRALEGYLKSTSESTRFAATQALCRMGAPSGYQLAHKLLSSSDRWERRHGLALFEGARAKDADKMLRPMLRDPDPVVGAIAARILYQGGDEKMLDWLVVTSAKSSNDVRLAYENELEQLHLADDRRKQILARAGIKAPAQ
ncbi:MAG TPA: HEAT repeat domain-containing protein [Myxococcaceae bacterium]|nr:HEAT repeat domain-containing protein [Myxococcaceae bacterium]